MKVLTTPSRVASSLDWRKALGGAILTMSIHSDKIDMAVAQHPSIGKPVKTLPPLKLEKKGRVVPQDSRRRLSDIVKEQHICAFVVSWPVQPDNGKMGYAAGRTVWTLEELLKSTTTTGSSSSSKTTTTSNSTTISPNRPVCFWDGSRSTTQKGVADMWGRNPDYATTTDKTLHLASMEQYHTDDAIVVSQVWDDFMKVNWPGVYYNAINNQQSMVTTPPSKSVPKVEYIDEEKYLFNDEEEEKEYLSAEMVA